MTTKFLDRITVTADSTGSVQVPKPDAGSAAEKIMFLFQGDNDNPVYLVKEGVSSNGDLNGAVIPQGVRQKYGPFKVKEPFPRTLYASQQTDISVIRLISDDDFESIPGDVPLVNALQSSGAESIQTVEQRVQESFPVGIVGDGAGPETYSETAPNKTHDVEVNTARLFKARCVFEDGIGDGSVVYPQIYNGDPSSSGALVDGTGLEVPSSGVQEIVFEFDKGWLCSDGIYLTVTTALGNDTLAGFGCALFGSYST